MVRQAVQTLTRVHPLVYVLGVSMALCVLAVAGRVLFAPIPNVQPVTFLVSIAGFALGPWAGVSVGIGAAVGSNQFLGQGPWTVWQALVWGSVGLTAGLLKMVFPVIKARVLIGFNFLWGYLFGWMMNIWFCTYFYFTFMATGRETSLMEAYLMSCLSSFWFDTAHAVGNVVFCIVFGVWALKALDRHRQ